MGAPLGPADENLDAGRDTKLAPDEVFIRNLHLHPVLLAVITYQDKPNVGGDGGGAATRGEAGHFVRLCSGAPGEDPQVGALF